MDKEAAGRALEAIVAHLGRHNVAYARELSPIMTELRRAGGAADSEGLRARIRGLFGGMGTLNDVAILRLNGHSVENEEEANRVLDALREELWAAIHP